MRPLTRLFVELNASFKMQPIRVVSSLAVLLVVGVCAFQPLALAQQTEQAMSPSMKADVPKMDPDASEHKAVQKKPLQAGIQHNEKYDNTPVPVRPYKTGVSDGGNRGFIGKLRGGTKTAESNPLRGKANDNGGGAFNITAQSSYGIIGVKFVLAMGRPPVINRVFPGTPAADKGLRPDDLIVAVDGVPTVGLTKEEVYDLIIGSPGTPVKLSIMRGGDFQVFSCIRMDINELTDPVVRRDYMMSM